METRRDAVLEQLRRERAEVHAAVRALLRALHRDAAWQTGDVMALAVSVARLVSNEPQCRLTDGGRGPQKGR